MRRFWYFFTVLPLAKLRLSWFKFTVMSMPIVVLAAMMVILNILSTSAWHIAQDKVLPAIGDREKLIGVDKGGVMNIAGQKIDPAPYFTEDELANFDKRSNLASVTVVRPGHGLAGSSSDLISGTSFFTNHINGIDDRVAKLMGVDDFVFKQGQPIPIIIGRNSLKEWREIVSDIATATDDQRQEWLEDFQRQPLYTKVLSDNATLQSLLGKTFTMRLGGLTPLPVLYSTQTLDGQVYKLIPSDVRQQAIKQTEAEIAKYWHVGELEQGIEVEFEVVGLDYSLDSGAVGVPFAAITYLENQLQQHTARAQFKPVEPDLLGRTFVGLQLKDDGYLWADSSYGGRLSISQQADMVDHIFIPGLVYPNPSSENLALADNHIAAEQFPPTRITLEARALGDKTAIFNSLIRKGYGGFSSTSNYDGVERYAQGWQSLSQNLIKILAIIAILITGFLMLRTVKQSQFDTGVMRALGASKDWTLLSYAGLFSWQLGLAIGAGLLIGGGAMWVAAPYLADMLQHNSSLSLDLILRNYGLIITLQPADMRYIDWLSLGKTVGWMVLIAAVGVAVAAMLAIRVSPVEAVRRE